MARSWRLLAMLEARRLGREPDPALVTWDGTSTRGGAGSSNGIRQSMSCKGNCLDNAATEQVFDTLLTSSTGARIDSYDNLNENLTRVRHPLEHQTTPDTTRGTHPGGISVSGKI